MGRYIKLASQLETVNFSNVNAGDTVTAVNANFSTLIVNGNSITSSGATSLASLSDVSLSGSSNGQSLIYNSTSSKWVNGTPAGFSSGSFATTGSNTFNGNQIITGSLTLSSSAATELTVIGNSIFTGSLTVFTGSGIEFQVLSTGVKIGNLITDIHTVTGSLNISGSVFITSSLGVGVAPSATVGRIDASNDVVAFSTSDIRFKKNITPIPNALDKLNKIGGYTFDWNPDPELTKLHGFKGHDIGVIAQEIEKVLPELVTTRDNGYKAVKYEKLVALLIESNKELLKRIEVLESKINQ